ncbi:MAG: TraR/DksA C4-type zinc finger protein [Bacteroidia bacterium]|jgi:RNA polymerase-binding protein DksA
MNVYSKQELQEFKELILQKLAVAQQEYDGLLEQLDDNGTSDTDPIWHDANYVTETTSKEEISHNAGRLKKFIDSLKIALVRIENGTYGICVKTGKLIPKGRLMAVPHATLSIDAKRES